MKIISGKYKNQIGKILEIIYRKNQVIVENINMKTKHVKPKREEEKGEILSIEAPIHKSNITIHNI
uniref:Large ribosomal subunit protein uL24c n=1 Tax=Callithamnion tetricum TaxID=193179 RepID=A0A4D6WN04_9FLOR|nr:ribosomal protein L24 [Callithamnion tetricum]